MYIHIHTHIHNYTYVPQSIYLPTYLSIYLSIYSFIYLSSALHLAIIHNQQEVVLQLLDVLPQLPPTETPVVDCLNNFKQVRL